MITRLVEADDPLAVQALQSLRHDIHHLPAYLRAEAKRLAVRGAYIIGREKTQNFLFPLLIRPLPEVLGAPADWADAMTPYGYASPLGPDHLLPSFLEKAIDLCRENKIVSVFVRWHPLLSRPVGPPLAREERVLHGETVVIDLSESASDWTSQTRKSFRYEIRRLQNLGFQVSVNRWENLRAFHDMFLSTMERVGASTEYLFSFDYFEELIQNLSPHISLITVESAKREVAAGALFTESCGIVQYHLSGVSPDFLKLSPTKLLIDFARHWAKKRGHQTLHLGGGFGAASNALFAFKAGFSKHRTDFYTSRIVSDPDAFDKIMSSAPPTRTAVIPNTAFFPPYRSGALWGRA